LVHKYETLSRTNTSTSSFKATKRPIGTVFKFVVKGILRNRRAQKYEELCKQPFAELPEIRPIQVTKNTLPSLAFGFFPGELWCSE